MEFDSLDGNIKLHIGCEKEYLQGWINVNTNPDDSFVEADATWDLCSIVFWKKHSIDLIYVEDFLDDIRQNENGLELMLATYKHILKPTGMLVIGLISPDYVHSIAPWLKKIGLENVIYFDVSDYDNKVFIPYEV